MKLQVDGQSIVRLERGLQQLEPAVSEKVLKAGLRDAARPLVPAIRGRTRRKSGNLQRSVRIKSVSDNYQEAKILVGYSQKIGAGGRHARLYMNGIAGKGRSRRGPSDPVTDAYREKGAEVEARFTESMEKKIKPELKKLGFDL